MYLKLNGFLLPRSHSWQVDVFDDLLAQLKIHAIGTHGELEAHRLMGFSHWTWSFFPVHKILKVQVISERVAADSDAGAFSKGLLSPRADRVKRLHATAAEMLSQEVKSRSSIGPVCRLSHVQADLVNQREIWSFDVWVKRQSFYRIYSL